MFEKFTDRSRKVLNLAEQEAKRLNHEYLGTEHVLLGLIKEGSGVGATVLKNYDLSLEKLRLETEKLVKPGPEIITMGKLPYTPRAKKIVEYAIEYARSLSHNHVGTEHLLYGVVAERGGIASQILQNFELNTEKIKKSIEDLLGITQENQMNMKSFLEGHNYKINKCSVVNSPGNFEVAIIDNTPTIYYSLTDKEQITEALGLRSLLDKNNVKYNEKPPASDVARILRSSVSNTISLADRLEKN